MMKKLLLNILLYFGVMLGMQVSVLGQDSARTVGILNSGAETGITNKRALIIGISDYNSPKLTLRYADDDAELFYEYLKDIEQLPEENIDTLFNHHATAGRIYASLQSLVETTKEGDLTYIYFAGHGDVVTRFIKDEGYFLAADANDQREYNGTGGIVAFNHLNEAVDAIIQKKGKVILILDACRSGYVVNADGANKTLASLNSSFQNTTKFLSSQANQLSYESEAIGHGYFTYYLTLGMMGAADVSAADNELQYVELAQFLNQNVKNETGGKQSPVVQDKDLFRPYRTVLTADKELALSAMQQTGGIKDMLASRSVEAPKGGVPKEQDSFIKAFNKALKEANYAGNDSSAYTIYRKAEENPTYPGPLKKQMKRTLTGTLSTFSQLIINSYIGAENPLPAGSEFDKAAEYLGLSLGIMDKDAYNYVQLATSELFLKGYSIIRKKDYSHYANAKDYLLEALEKEPRAAYIHNALGILYSYEEDYVNAELHYKKAAELIPTWAFPVNNIGSNYLDQHNYDKAETYFKQSMALDSTLDLSYNNLGVVFERRGNYSRAESFYKASLAHDATDPTVFKNIGNINSNRGNLKAAENWYKKALAADPGFVDSYYALANFLYDNDLDEEYARSLLHDAITLQPYYATGYAKLADFYRKSARPEDLSKADSLYAKAITLDPFYTWGYAGRGWLYHKQDNNEQALEMFKKSIEQNPAKPEAHYYLGNYYLNGLKQLDDAIKEYENVINLDSLYFSAYEKLVDIYAKEKAYGNAKAIAQTIIKRNGKAPDAWNLWGNLHFQMGDYNTAIKAYQQALELDSTYAKGYVNLGYSYIDRGKYAEAQNCFLKANTYNPYKNKLTAFADYLLSQAGREQRAGEKEKTEQLLHVAYNLDKHYKKTLFDLAAFYYLQNDAGQALDYTQRLSGQHLSRSERIQFLILSLKIAMDQELTEHVEKSFYELNTINPRNDYLLSMLAYNSIGKNKERDKARTGINKAQLRDAYLKRNYSSKTIQLIYNLMEEHIHD